MLPRNVRGFSFVFPFGGHFNKIHFTPCDVSQGRSRMSGIMNTSPLLTLEGIYSIKAELDNTLRIQAELPSKIANLQKRLDAAMLFAPPGFDLETRLDVQQDLNGIPSRETVASTVPNVNATGRITWIGELERILKESNQGRSYNELLGELNRGVLGNKPSAGDKGFYNAIAKLISRKNAVKHSGLLYSTDVFNKLKEGGAVFPEFHDEHRRGSSATIVLEILKEHPKGLTANELKAILATREGVPKSISAYGQYIYNVVGGLVGRGSVKKKDDKYVLVSK
jgi:hypothetical protein